MTLFVFPSASQASAVFNSISSTTGPSYSSQITLMLRLVLGQLCLVLMCLGRVSDSVQPLLKSRTNLMLSPPAFNHHLQENLEGQPQGWLARDHQSWFSSNQRLHRLAKMTGGRVIPGHDEPIVSTLLGKTLT